MGWRRIVVDGIEYRWTTSVSVSRSSPSELPELRLMVIIRGPERITATFHGWAVEDLWDGRRQSLAIRPATVAEIIKRAATAGPALDHAERLFPGAVVGGDGRDAELAAACAQWFVPYPGRVALEAALVETDFDHARVAARFGVTPVQIAAWATRLGIAR